MPKALEKIAMLFPTVHLFLIILSAGFVLTRADLLSVTLSFFIIYLLPLSLWCLIKIKYPIKKGFSEIGQKSVDGNPWVVAHRLQYLYITFSAIEKILILIPGAFSCWLRLWGSQIGKNIIWTPRIQIIDRTDIVIGDNTFIGDLSYLSSHFIVRKKDKLFLFYDSVKIGTRVLIGAHCHLGPGARIKDQEFLPAYSKTMRGRKIKGNEGGHGF